MNPPQFFAEFDRRTLGRLSIACATAAFLLVVAATVPLASFEAAFWEVKVLLRVLAPAAAQARAGNARLG
jgi:hypothetical protein